MKISKVRGHKPSWQKPTSANRVTVAPLWAKADDCLTWWFQQILIEIVAEIVVLIWSNFNATSVLWDYLVSVMLVTGMGYFSLMPAVQKVCSWTCHYTDIEQRHQSLHINHDRQMVGK